MNMPKPRITRSVPFFRLILTFYFLIGFLASPLTAEASIFVVNTVNDVDDGLCDTNHCSLREAITAANNSPGPDTISFDIPGSGVHRIELCHALPSLTDGGTTLDGTTEPDYTGVPIIIIEPRFTPSDLIYSLLGLPTCSHIVNGIQIVSSSNEIRGLSLVSFNSDLANQGTAIRIMAGSGNLIESNYLGIEPSGAVRGNRNAISITDNSQTIRGNVISGNRTGIHAGWMGNHVIQSNFIGTNPTGAIGGGIIGNEYGIILGYTASNVMIGGAGPGEGNLISGNQRGIFIISSGNTIQGNLIGTDVSGEKRIQNYIGVYIGGLGNNLIGGSAPGEGNVISGNSYGIKIEAGSNTVQGNLIGTNKSGDARLENSSGISLSSFDAANNLIGGPNSGEGNLISGNSKGIVIYFDAMSNQVQGNLIGTDISGNSPIPNRWGVWLQGKNNTVGGTTSGEGNLIAHSGYDGILVQANAQLNTIAYNTIIQNNQGIYVKGNEIVHGNTISHNAISGNGGLGIDIYPFGYNLNDPGDPDTGANTMLNFPEITSAKSSGVSGTSCPSCTVEIFLADDDPSFHGEGMTFLAETIASPNGNFSTIVGSLGLCTPITATATDLNGNTSEFSLNASMNCIKLRPPILYPIIIFIITVYGIIFWGIRRIRPSTPVWLIPVGAIVGGIGSLTLIIALPNVEVEMEPRMGEVSEPPLAECLQFLDRELFAPMDGQVFETYDNPDLHWGWADDPPQGDFRWSVELLGPEGLQIRRTTSEVQMLFSAFGLSPFPGDQYDWRLTLEESQPDSGEWQAFCRPTMWRSFRLGSLPEPETPTPTREIPPTPTETSTPTLTPTTCVPALTALMNTTCRFGPSSSYKDQGYLLLGESALIEGQNADGTWYWIPNPDWAGNCYVWNGAVEVSCPGSYPIIADPPTPTSPPLTCSEDLNEEECIGAGGEWFSAREFCSCPSR